MLPALQLTSGTAAVLLLLLLAAFAMRVAGQLVVVVAAPPWLPPMDQWFSGVVAYPILLAVQLVTLVLMAAVALGLGAGWPLAISADAGLGRTLVAVAYLYAAAMAVRYVLRMARRPDQRWFGGTIPIVFHCVVAAFLWTFGTFHVS